MKALLLAHSNGGGGAGRAANRLMHALSDAGVDVRMHVDFRDDDDARVTRNGSLLADAGRRARITTEEVPAFITRHPQPRLFSPGIVSAISARRINASSADVVNLHWTGFGYLSIEDIGRISKPLVWAMHDMWAFTGGLGYDDESADARWRSGYADSNGPLDIERWVARRKLRAWKRPIHLVTPSNWLAGLAAGSPITGAWPIRVIPNALEVAEFIPMERSTARARFGIDPAARVVGVVLGGTADDPRKGLDLLAAALSGLARELPEAQVAVIGIDTAPTWWDVPLHAHWLGRLDGADLTTAYNVADVVVVPSRQDNLPQTATEAAACGRPIVAFEIGGLADIVEDGVSGVLVPAFGTAAMTHAIQAVLADPSRAQAMGAAARAHAVAHWAPGVVATQYIDAFTEAIESTR